MLVIATQFQVYIVTLVMLLFFFPAFEAEAKTPIKCHPYPLLLFPWLLHLHVNCLCSMVNI
jgi:hypothetical protein